jgi:hypothetical protein
MSMSEVGNLISVLVGTLSLATLLVAAGVPIWVLADWWHRRSGPFASPGRR